MSPLDGVNVRMSDLEGLAADVAARQSPQIANVDDLTGRAVSQSRQSSIVRTHREQSLQTNCKPTPFQRRKENKQCWPVR
ncbi:MAG TPA: hypothetical protein VF396_06515 [Bradyrhizobium sp.]